MEEEVILKEGFHRHEEIERNPPKTIEKEKNKSKHWGQQQNCIETPAQEAPGKEAGVGEHPQPAL